MVSPASLDSRLVYWLWLPAKTGLIPQRKRSTSWAFARNVETLFVPCQSGKLVLQRQVLLK